MALNEHSTSDGRILHIIYYVSWLYTPFAFTLNNKASKNKKNIMKY